LQTRLPGLGRSPLLASYRLADLVWRRAELADASIVFRFGHRPEVVEAEPEQASHGPKDAEEADPDATGSLALDPVAGEEQHTEPEQDVPACAEELRPHLATEASPMVPPSDDEAPERAVAGSDAGAVAEGGLTAAGTIFSGESEMIGAGLVPAESTATGTEGSDDASTVDGSGGQEATAMAGLEEPHEDVSEGSTAHDFDTDVDSESSTSSGEEQGTQFGVPLQPVVRLFSCVFALILQQT
jgi:hypothetical protein